MNLNDADDLDPTETEYARRRRRFKTVEVVVRGGGINGVEFATRVTVDTENPEAGRQKLLQMRDLLMSLVPVKELAALDREYVAEAPEVIIDAKGRLNLMPQAMLNALRIQEQLQRDTKGMPDASGRERKPDQEGAGGGAQPKGKG